MSSIKKDETTLDLLTLALFTVPNFSECTLSKNGQPVRLVPQMQRENIDPFLVDF
jgi:hypothetical protein